MTIVANPNWLAVAGAVFFLSGIGFFAKGVLSAGDKEMLRTLDIGLGAGLAGFAGVLNVAAQLVSIPFNAVAVCLLLGLAFGILVYGLLEAQVPDLRADGHSAKRAAKISLLAPPAAAPVALEPPRVLEVAAQS